MTALQDYVAAFFGHMGHALLTGLLPICAIILIVHIILKIFSADGEIARIGTLFAAVGALIGLLLGSSREPAVQVVIPALVTLITGWLGWTLTQESRKSPGFLMGIAADNAEDKTEAKQTKYATKLVVAAVFGLMLSTAFGSMWGASMRMQKEQDDRRYSEWLMNYEKIELPIQADLNRRALGLPVAGAEAAGTEDAGGGEADAEDAAGE